MNESPEASQNVRKMERIKDSWYHQSPRRLFDMCIDVLVNNIDLILVKKKKKKKIKSADHHDVGGKGGKMVTYQNELDHSLQAYRRGQGCRNKSARSSKSSQQLNSRVKYDLAENVGPLPATICEAIITRYSQFYLSELGKLEREEYFQIMNAKTKSVNKVIESLDREFLASPNTQAPSKQSNEPLTRSSAAAPEVRRSSCGSGRRRKKLVTHFDLIMTFASRSDKCSLNSLQYRQCMWAHSTLEQRLKARRLNRIQFIDAVDSTSNYFTSFSSSTSSSSDESESEVGASDAAASDGDNVSNYYDCFDASSTGGNMTIEQSNSINTSLERHHHHQHRNPPSTEVDKQQTASRFCKKKEEQQIKKRYK